MKMKLICSLICIGLVAGLKTPFQLSHTPNQITKQESINILEEFSKHSNIAANNKLPTSSHHHDVSDHRQSTASNYKITAEQESTNIREELLKQSNLTVNNKQPTTGHPRSTVDHHHQSTAGNYKITGGKSQPITHKQYASSFLNSDTLTDQEFLCNDGKFRILYINKCDGAIDCPDGSDEFPDLCHTTSPRPGSKKCNSQEFQCPLGKCISKNKNANLSDIDCWGNAGLAKDDFKKYCSGSMLLCDNSTKCVAMENRCDGKLDCVDKTDELIARTQELNGPSFRCGNGNCISKREVCNGVYNCEDHSDEKSCNNYEGITKRPNHQPCSGYICSSGECIHSNQFCDGNNDCKDNSDEASCDDDDAWFWSSNKGLIVSLSVLGGAVFATIAAVVVVTICYRRKYKALKTEMNNMDNEPPPYWQAVGGAAVGHANNYEQKLHGYDNHFFGGSAVLPA